MHSAFNYLYFSVFFVWSKCIFKLFMTVLENLNLVKKKQLFDIFKKLLLFHLKVYLIAINYVDSQIINTFENICHINSVCAWNSVRTDKFQVKVTLWLDKREKERPITHIFPFTKKQNNICQKLFYAMVKIFIEFEIIYLY